MSRFRLHPCLLLALFLATPQLSRAQVWEVGNILLEPPSSQYEGYFGWAIAIGDFNGDDIDDLAVGTPGWDSPTLTDAGLVTFYWGGTDRTLTFATSYEGSGSTDDSNLGFSVAAGDFDNDGRDEIAVGVPNRDVGKASNAGEVWVFGYDAESWSQVGTLSQLDTTPDSAPETNDHFGRTLVTGNFNGDDYADLAVGVPLEAASEDSNSGAVQIFYGSSTGLRTDNPVTLWSSTFQTDQEFGFSLAAGDFDDDGYDDLAVGAPFRVVSAQISAGAVEIFSGTSGGIDPTPQVIDDSDTGDVVEDHDYFGTALAAGQFDQSLFLCVLLSSPCYDDLAISAPGQSLSAHDDAGKVIVGYGGASGLDPSSPTVLSQSDFGLAEETDDQFGSALASGFLNPDLGGPSDLAIGTPYESYQMSDDGVVDLAFGDSAGVNQGLPDQLIFQRPGYEIPAAADDDHFGFVLAIGDFDHDLWGDLVIGVPFKNKGEIDSGVVQVLYGAIFADGFEGGSSSMWVP